MQETKVEGDLNHLKDENIPRAILKQCPGTGDMWTSSIMQGNLHNLRVKWKKLQQWRNKLKEQFRTKNLGNHPLKTLNFRCQAERLSSTPKTS